MQILWAKGALKPMWGINGNEIHNDVFDQIISLDNLFLAWREFKRGKTKKLEVQEFELSV